MPKDLAVTEAPRELVSRALSNLVRNSIQHSPSGAVVHVSVRADSDSLVVVVEDTGSPLSTAVRATVFTAQGQIGAKSTAAGRYSRGLGLLCAALAASAAEASVRVIDPPSGKGNAFELVLPR